MVINKKKQELQYKLANYFLKKNGIGTFMLPTGVSKSRIPLIVAKHLIDKNKIDSVLIIVPMESIKEDTWPSEIRKWLGEEYLKFFRIECIQSIYLERLFYQFVIADEIHNYIPNYDDFISKDKKYVKFFIENEINYLMGLSAYIPEKKVRTLEQLCPVLFKMDIAQAVVDGYISNFKICNIPVKLSDEQRYQYNIIEKSIDDYAKKLGGPAVAYMNANSIINGLSGRNLQALPESERVKFGIANKYRKLIGERKIFLSENKNKIDICNQIVNYYTDKCIVFSSSKDFAKTFASLRNDTVEIHSGITKVKRKNLLKQFREDNSNTIKCLSAVNAINEGINVPKVKMSILASGNSTIKDLVQRLGRNLRLLIEGKDAIFIQLYLEDTQDQKWTFNRIKKIPKDKIINLNNLQELLQIL